MMIIRFLPTSCAWLSIQARIQGGARGARPPPIFGLAVPNLSPTLHARTPMTPPAPPPPYFQILDPPLSIIQVWTAALAIRVCGEVAPLHVAFHRATGSRACAKSQLRGLFVLAPHTLK